MYRLLNIEPLNYSRKAKKIISELCLVDEFSSDREDVLKIIQAYDILITRLNYNIDEVFLSYATKLKIIVTATTGLDHIDLECAHKKDIVVLSLRGETSFLSTVTATAEHTWCLILSLYRKLPFAFQSIFAGEWERDKFNGRELKEKVLGIIGFGRLGKMVAAYGKAFGMKVIIFDPFVDQVDQDFVTMDELLKDSDIVSLHIPFTQETKDFFDHSKMEKMKKGACIINTSRGMIIEEKALLFFLENKHLGGAALDVLANEEKHRKKDMGWPGDDPLVEFARNHDNLIITPHIGGKTSDSSEATELFMAKKLTTYLSRMV